jgi:hypothetical protein
MAEVVELFGAPGTGKSSLVRALDGRRVGGRSIVAGERLLRVARRSGPPAAGASGSAGAALTPGAPLAAGALQRLVERASRRDRTPAERRALVASRREDWSDLLALLRDAPLGRDGVDPLQMLHAPAWLVATFELRALADAADDRFVVVIGEGFAQRARLVCGDRPDAAALARCVAALPAAGLQVHLQADPEVLVGRLRSRERVIDRHIGLDAAALAASVARDARLLADVADLMRARGDDVLDVTTAAAPGAPAGVREGTSDASDGVRLVVERLARRLG